MKKNLIYHIIFLSGAAVLCTKAAAPGMTPHDHHSVAPAPLTPSFIITPQASTEKKRSKNGLKEDIGESMQEVMHRCALLTHKLGELQMQLAQIQSHLVTSARELVENDGSVRKASKKQLAEGLHELKNAEKTLRAHASSVKHLNKTLRATPAFKMHLG